MALDLEEESKFAKIVNTPNGPAILIAGSVIDVVVPAGLDKEAVVGMFTRAMRRQIHYDAASALKVSAQCSTAISGSLSNTLS